MPLREEVNEVLASYVISIRGTEEIPAGQTLKVETTPSGLELYSRTVPNGKRWIIQASMDIQELPA